MKVLVLGCNGMAGHVVSLHLQDNGFNVTGLARSPKIGVPTIICDVTDFAKLQTIIGDGNYDVVINCVGILNHYAQEHKGNAVLINAYLPHYLAELTADTKTQVIQISTDCVFSGQRGKYKETDICDGQTFYDRSKALGEIIDNKNLTIRTSIIGPDLNPDGIGLLNWFMQQDGPVYGYTKAIWTGQTTLQLAKTIEQAIIQKLAGLHHLVPEMQISKYNLLLLCNKYIRKNSIKILPDENILIDKSLVRGEDSFKYSIPGYETMIPELVSWISKHRSLYPHYEIKE